MERISEAESTQLLDMMDCCNASSHIYAEETAERIMTKIPSFFNLMHAIGHRVSETLQFVEKKDKM